MKGGEFTTEFWMCAGAMFVCALASWSCMAAGLDIGAGASAFGAAWVAGSYATSRSAAKGGE